MAVMLRLESGGCVNLKMCSGIDGVASYPFGCHVCHGTCLSMPLT